MVDIKPITDEERELLEKRGRGMRGRISYPIIKMFMESGLDVARIEPSEGQTITSLMASLKHYIQAHNMPLEVLKRRNSVYLRHKQDLEKTAKPLGEAIKDR